jgi:hypothetical protein
MQNPNSDQGEGTQQIRELHAPGQGVMPRVSQAVAYTGDIELHRFMSRLDWSRNGLWTAM